MDLTLIIQELILRGYLQPYPPDTDLIQAALIFLNIIL